MIVFVLVVWFGIGSSQSSFSVPGIASKAECERLGASMKSHYGGGFAEVKCHPYRIPAAKAQ